MILTGQGGSFVGSIAKKSSRVAGVKYYEF